MKDQNSKEKRIGVLMGGMSRERDISLKSGKAIANPLASVTFPLQILAKRLTKVGLIPDDQDPIARSHGRRRPGGYHSEQSHFSTPTLAAARAHRAAQAPSGLSLTRRRYGSARGG